MRITTPNNTPIAASTPVKLDCDPVSLSSSMETGCSITDKDGVPYGSMATMITPSADSLVIQADAFSNQQNCLSPFIVSAANPSKRFFPVVSMDYEPAMVLKYFYLFLDQLDTPTNLTLHLQKCTTDHPTPDTEPHNTSSSTFPSHATTDVMRHQLARFSGAVGNHIGQVDVSALPYLRFPLLQSIFERSVQTASFFLLHVKKTSLVCIMFNVETWLLQHFR